MADQHRRRDRVYREPRFKQVETEEPVMRQASFEDARAEDPGGARWAGETTPDRIDSRLRTRRIRALTWEPEEQLRKSRWERFKEWLRR